MRRFSAAMAVALGLAAAPAVTHADTTQPDWILFKITAGSGGVQGGFVGAFATLSYSGDEAPSVAAGVARPGRAPFVAMYGGGGGRMEVATTDDLGGVQVTVREKSEGGHGIGLGAGIGTLQPGQTMAVVLFGTGGFIAAATIDVRPDSGTVTITRSEGTGSRPLIPVSGSQGVAVQAASGAAGMSSRSATSPAGLVGTFAGFECGDVCQTGWAASDGRRGGTTFTAVHAEIIGSGSWSQNTAFAGPPGDWRWTWQGARRPGALSTLNASAPIYGAWAPIGDDWTLFRQS